MNDIESNKVYRKKHL